MSVADGQAVNRRRYCIAAKQGEFGLDDRPLAW